MFYKIKRVFEEFLFYMEAYLKLLLFIRLEHYSKNSRIFSLIPYTRLPYILKYVRDLKYLSEMLWKSLTSFLNSLATKGNIV